MPRPLRFAIVGLDHWYSAVPLAGEIAAHPDAELVVIADTDPERAAEVGRQLGVPSTADLSVAADSGIDVVASFVSPDRNPEICIAAARAGNHIVSVKPMARTSVEAMGMAEVVDACGVTFVPAESRPRRSELGIHLKELVHSGRRGRLLTANFTVSGHPPQAWPGTTDSGWWTDPSRTAGGAWIDHAIYDIDRMRALLGADPISVSAHVANLRHVDMLVEDFGHAVFEFPDGVMASMEHTWTAAPGAGRVAAMFAFEGGTVSVDSIGGRLSTSAPPGQGPGWASAPAPSDAPPLDSLIAALRGEAPILGDVHDGLANLIACETAYRAAHTGRAEAVPPAA